MIVTLPHILLVALGGAFGCTSRFLIIRLIMRLNPGIFPIGTMVVNVLGSLLVGMFLARYGAHSSARVFFVTGLFGGLTTFSAFSWDAMQLLHRGQLTQAALYIGGSVLLAVGAVVVGFNLAK